MTPAGGVESKYRGSHHPLEKRQRLSMCGAFFLLMTFFLCGGLFFFLWGSFHHVRGFFFPYGILFYHIGGLFTLEGGVSFALLLSCNNFCGRLCIIYTHRMNLSFLTFVIGQTQGRPTKQGDTNRLQFTFIVHVSYITKNQNSWETNYSSLQSVGCTLIIEYRIERKGVVL